MKLLTKLTLLFSMFLSVLSLKAQNKNVVVYLDAVGAFHREELLVDYESMTHIIWSFALPTWAGTVKTLDVNQKKNLQRMTAEAHKYGVKVLVAFGGATVRYEIQDAITTAPKRAKMIESISQLVQDYDLDGIDIDYEFPTASEVVNFANFMTEVRAELDKLEGSNFLDKELELSMAVNAFTTSHTAGINATAMNACDFVNLMAYDNGANINHAAKGYVYDAINHWSAKGLAKNKMCMGLPAYGRGPNSSANTKTYAEILESDPAWFSKVDEGIGYYYNGLPTICEKTQNSVSEGLFGVMLWEASFDVLKDSPNYQYSILNKMAECIGLPKCDFADVPAKVELCGGSTTINASMGSGYTYQWRKDGKKVGTNASYTATSTGFYSVEVTTNEGCTRKSNIEVVNETPLTLIPSDTLCQAGQAELMVANTGGPFKWYEEETGGAALSTGRTYAPTINETTTYYVEGIGGNASNIYYEESLNYPDTFKGWFHDYSGVFYNHIRFHPYEAFEIDSVTVIVGPNQKGKEIKVSLLDSNTTLAFSSVIVETDEEGELRIPVNISVPKGAHASKYYYLTLFGGTAELWMDNVGGSYPINEFGLIEFTDVKTSFNFDGMRVPGIYDIGVHWNDGAGGCKRYPVEAVLDLCVGTDEISTESFKVYPNPSQGVFTIDLDNSLNVDSEIKIYSASGKVIQRIKSTQNQVVFGSDLAQGVYFLEVVKNGQSTVKKIIKK